MQREADKEEWSGASVAPIPRCVSPHAQWYLRSPLHVTSVIAHIFELAAWASAVGRQSSFDFKNDSSNSKLWVTPTFAFELCFFFQDQNQTRNPSQTWPYPLCYWGKVLTFFPLCPAESGLPHSVTTGQWKWSAVLLSLSCARPMCIRKAWIASAPENLSTSFFRLLEKSPFHWMNKLKIQRTAELF